MLTWASRLFCRRWWENVFHLRRSKTKHFSSFFATALALLNVIATDLMLNDCSWYDDGFWMRCWFSIFQYPWRRSSTQNCRLCSVGIIAIDMGSTIIASDKRMMWNQHSLFIQPRAFHSANTNFSSFELLWFLKFLHYCRFCSTVKSFYNNRFNHKFSPQRHKHWYLMIKSFKYLTNLLGDTTFILFVCLFLKMYMCSHALFLLALTLLKGKLENLF